MIPRRESDDAIFEQLCGSQFAVGQHRTVHEVIGHPEMVMKVARSNNHFANWCEYLVSTSLERHATGFHMGKVASISASGRNLLMERLSDLNRSQVGAAIPRWLNDVKKSAFGLSSQGAIKIRDYGMLKLGDELGIQRYICDEDRTLVPRKVPDGADDAFAMQMGPQIGVDSARSVHEVIGEPAMVMKVCNDSHKENALEWIIYAALAAIDAEELIDFASFESSRTGKYVLTEKLKDVPADFCGHLPAIPWWLPDDRSALGLDAHATAKIRRWADAKLGEVLMRAPVRRI
jgi:hypothetical protein